MINIHQLIRENIKRILESRISDFKEKYSNIPPNIRTVIIEKDPSKTHKYLPWIGKIMDTEIKETDFNSNDALELMNLINIFDKKSKGIDINNFNTLTDFEQYVEKIEGIKSKRAEIESGADLLFLNDLFRIVAPKDHA